jgi:hypothetical protein
MPARLRNAPAAVCFQRRVILRQRRRHEELVGRELQPHELRCKVNAGHRRAVTLP